MSRTRKREYTKTKRFDKSCRSHGSCPHCKEGREYKHKRRAPVEERENHKRVTTWTYS